MIIPSNDFFKKFKETHGAFSTPEAIALYQICLHAPPGLYLELGTHKGKSAMVAASALQPGVMYLVEPCFHPDHKDFFGEQELVAISDKIREASKGTIQPLFVGDYSTNVIPIFKNDLAFVFLDSGDHGEELVSEEVKMLEDRIMPGGILAFHDFGNQFTAVARWYEYLVNTGKYEEIKFDWGRIFDYVRENNLEEGNISWHEKGSEEFPKFVGALIRK